jgi:hypothetical protein
MGKLGYRENAAVALLIGDDTEEDRKRGGTA